MKLRFSEPFDTIFCVVSRSNSGVVMSVIRLGELVEFYRSEDGRGVKPNEESVRKYGFRSSVEGVVVISDAFDGKLKVAPKLKEDGIFMVEYVDENNYVAIFGYPEEIENVAVGYVDGDGLAEFDIELLESQAHYFVHL